MRLKHAIWIVVMMGLFSCQVTKRKYRPGFYLLKQVRSCNNGMEQNGENPVITQTGYFEVAHQGKTLNKDTGLKAEVKQIENSAAVGPAKFVMGYGQKTTNKVRALNNKFSIKNHCLKPRLQKIIPLGNTMEVKQSWGWGVMALFVLMFIIPPIGLALDIFDQRDMPRSEIIFQGIVNTMSWICGIAVIYLLMLPLIWMILAILAWNFFWLFIFLLALNAYD